MKRPTIAGTPVDTPAGAPAGTPVGAPRPPSGLAWRRGLARAVLLFEAGLPALLPAAAAAAVFAIAALLDLPGRMPWWAHAALLAVTAAAILVLLRRGFAGFSTPGPSAADRRLERDSGLTHRPLAALSDRPANPVPDGDPGADPIGQAVWRAHVARGLSQVRTLRLGLPHPGLARLDRRAFRHALSLGLLASLVVAGPDAPARLAAAFAPGLPRPAAAPPVEIQAWATPPAYTGLAPVFLKHGQRSVSVPDGSGLTIVLTGGQSVPALVQDAERHDFTPLDRTSFQVERTLTHSAALTVVRDGEPLARWDVAVAADRPPTVRWAEPPGPAEDTLRIRLPWAAADDYGVTGLVAELRLTARPEAPPIQTPVPLPSGTPKTAHGIHRQDLTAHPWAGLSVTARLVARDGNNQTGLSEDAAFDLPARVFHNQVAKALIEIRKGLSLHPGDRSEALEVLDGLLQNPGLFGADSGAFLNLSSIYYLLVRHKHGDVVPDAQARMWDLALHMEEGQTEESARALDRARQAVRDAMDRLAREPGDANRRDLEQKLKELREAIDRHMRAMVEEAMRNQEALPFDPNAEQLTSQDLDRLADEAREAAEEGRMDDAREKMAELERLLDRMKQARADKGQGNSQQRQKGRRQMGAVQDLVAREGALLDRSESRADQANRPRRILPDPAEPDPNAQRPQDMRTQQALRNALGEMMQQFGDLTGEVPPALTEADRAMRDAAQSLAAGNDAAAAGAEKRAIEALQKGAREMGQTLARQFGRGQRGGEQGEGEGFGAEGPMGMDLRDGRGDGRSGQGPLPGPPRRADSRQRDPLGRTNQGGAADDGDVAVPGTAEQNRAQAIQEELRRRGAEADRPMREREYIDRLLRRF